MAYNSSPCASSRISSTAISRESRRSSDALVAFYRDHDTLILIAAAAGLAVLYLVWFAAAIRVTLADAGEDGWGAEETPFLAAVGALFPLLAAVNAASHIRSTGLEIKHLIWTEQLGLRL